MNSCSRIPFGHSVGQEGIEPTTNGLKTHCSTSELLARKQDCQLDIDEGDSDSTSYSDE